MGICIFLVAINIWRPEPNGRDFADDIFKCASLNENLRISHKIFLDSDVLDLIGSKSALVQVMAWYLKSTSHYLPIYNMASLDYNNKPVVQIPQCTSSIFCNRNVRTCANFCYKIWNWCIVRYLFDSSWDLWDGFILGPGESQWNVCSYHGKTRTDSWIKCRYMFLFLLETVNIHMTNTLCHSWSMHQNI